MALTFNEFLSKFSKRKRQGKGWKVLCPAHDDHKLSLSITPDPNKVVLLNCFAGCKPEDVLKALGLMWSDFHNESSPDYRKSAIEANNQSKTPLGSNLSRSSSNDSQSHPKTPIKPHKRSEDKIVATYPYDDENGQPLYRKIRCENKKFYFEHFKHETNIWEKGLGDVRRVPYRWPQVIQAIKDGERVFPVEGEKDVETLESKGYVATTTSGGANSGLQEFAKDFQGADVIAIPDNDKPGRKYVEKAAKVLLPVVKRLAVLQLPGFEENDKKDITDWFEDGHTKEEFEELLNSDHLKEITCEVDIESLLGNSETELKDQYRGPQIKSIWANEVTPTKPDWLREGWLVKGGLHLLAGQQSAGKSTYVAYIIAQLIQGIKVGYISLEESNDRLTARLKVAGADLAKLALYEEVCDINKDGNAIEKAWSLPQDADALSDWIESLELSLVVIDGLGYAIKGSQDYANIASALSALAKVAEKTNCAILGLTHVKKGGTFDNVTAAIGSTAWSAVPRIVWVLGRDPSDDTGARRAVAVSDKTNYKKPKESAYSFTINNNPEFEVGYVANVEVSNITADAIVAPKISGEEKSALGEAKAFLEVFLANGGVNAAEVKKAATSEGISDATLQRAKNQLGIQSKRVNDQSGKVHNWEWSLPIDQSPLSKKNDEYLDYMDISAVQTSYSPHTHSEDDEHVDFTSSYAIKDQLRTSDSLMKAKLPLKDNDEYLDYVGPTGTFGSKNYPGDQDTHLKENEHLDSSDNDESTNADIAKKVISHNSDDLSIYDESYFLNNDEAEPRDLLDSELPKDTPDYGDTKLLKTYSDGSPFYNDEDIESYEHEE